MPTKSEYRRKKARRTATKLYLAVANARNAKQQLAAYERLWEHVPELVHAFSTKGQMRELYEMGLPGDQLPLFGAKKKTT